jgi:lysophospholipase L1-like esterase
MQSNSRSIPGLTGIVSVALASAVLISSCRTAWHLARSVRLARKSRPFSTLPPAPAASLLIVGDSTGVGTGASAPQYSLAGQIARVYPNLRILNLAQDGARFAEIADQLSGTRRFDLILILGGGNDVIRMTGGAALGSDIERAIARACARSSHVIVMPAGNVGNAPVFYPPLTWLLRRRARTLHHAAARSAQAHGAVFVDLYRERANDPFARHPERMNASDRLHPNDAGYAYWFAELERQAQISQRIATVAQPTLQIAPRGTRSIGHGRDQTRS